MFLGSFNNIVAVVILVVAAAITTAVGVLADAPITAGCILVVGVVAAGSPL